MKLVDIHDELKREFKPDLVIIQQGFYMRTWNEDARYLSELCNLNLANTKVDGTGDIYTGFYATNIDMYEQKFIANNLSYIILELEEISENDEIYFSRIVTRSTIKSCIGKIYKNSNPKKIKTDKNKMPELDRNDDATIWLNAILNGIIAHTGEKLDKSSAWTHPQILEDIEEFLTTRMNIDTETKPNNKKYKYNGQTFDSYPKYVNALKNSEERCNTYNKWTEEDDRRLIQLSETLSLLELCNEFKRMPGGIRSRLKKLNITHLSTKKTAQQKK